MITYTFKLFVQGVIEPIYFNDITVSEAKTKINILALAKNKLVKVFQFDKEWEEQKELSVYSFPICNFCSDTGFVYDIQSVHNIICGECIVGETIKKQLKENALSEIRKKDILS